MKILFICTGNASRSALAEVVLRKMLADHRIGGIDVASCGTEVPDGLDRETMMCRIAAEHGYVMGGKAVAITGELLESADLIIVMAERHRQEVVRIQAMSGSRRIVRFNDYCFGEASDLPDPHYQTEHVYRTCFDAIERGCRKIIGRLGRLQDKCRGSLVGEPTAYEFCDMEIHIETERLILRSWKYEDRESFAEMNGNGNVMRYFPATLSVDESNAFVDRIIAEFEETGFGLYAVEIKETCEFIGYVGFHRFTFDVPFSPGWEIGWRISDRFWHKGYAVEAAKACLDHARAKHLCNRLYSFTAVPNIPSENVMKRIGMSYQGTFMHPALADGHWLKEHRLYSIEL